LKNSIEKKKILIAPLNWGLGHATRCIPIINTLIKEGFEPILAGDGDSLKLLQKEFPKLKNYQLPSYNIQYTKKGKNLKYKLLFNAPQIIKAVKKEQEVVHKIIEREKITGLISDNRFGVRSNKIPSVYITHQVYVLSGVFTYLTSKIHQRIIAKFDVCWVPDYESTINLSGKLSHPKLSKLDINYIQPISRFNYDLNVLEESVKIKKYDIMVLLSGPEPQRSILEKKLLSTFKSTTQNVLFVRGIISVKKNETQKINSNNKNIKLVKFMRQNELQKAILESKIIISRSGYSTIMDLEKLHSKVFFIPTPGQFEQEYLAKHLEFQNIAPFASQNDFNLEMLVNTTKYKGFTQKKIVNENQFPLTIFK